MFFCIGAGSNWISCVHEGGTWRNEITVMAIKISQVGCAPKMCCKDQFSILMSVTVLRQRAALLSEGTSLCKGIQEQLKA